MRGLAQAVCSACLCKQEVTCSNDSRSLSIHVKCRMPWHCVCVHATAACHGNCWQFTCHRLSNDVPGPLSQTGSLTKAVVGGCNLHCKPTWPGQLSWRNSAGSGSFVADDIMAVFFKECTQWFASATGWGRANRIHMCCIQLAQ